MLKIITKVSFTLRLSLFRETMILIRIPLNIWNLTILNAFTILLYMEHSLRQRKVSTRDNLLSKNAIRFTLNTTNHKISVIWSINWRNVSVNQPEPKFILDWLPTWVMSPEIYKNKYFSVKIISIFEIEQVNGERPCWLPSRVLRPWISTPHEHLISLIFADRIYFDLQFL